MTLAGLFVLRGLTLAITRSVTGRTQIPYITDGQEDSFVVWLFGGKFLGGFYQWMGSMGWVEVRDDGASVVPGLSMSIAWWMVLAVLATWL